MISLEEVRQVVVGAFQTFQNANYPSMLVNYPNFVVVDLEHQELPFISLDIEFNETAQAALGEQEIFVRGRLNIYYYYRTGGGVSGSYSYTDALNSNLGMSMIDGVRYEATQVVNVVSFPGWKGCMNTIPFVIVEGVVC